LGSNQSSVIETGSRLKKPTSDKESKKMMVEVEDETSNTNSVKKRKAHNELEHERFTQALSKLYAQYNDPPPKIENGAKAEKSEIDL